MCSHTTPKSESRKKMINLISSFSSTVHCRCSPPIKRRRGGKKKHSWPNINWFEGEEMLQRNSKKYAFCGKKQTISGPILTVPEPSFCAHSRALSLPFLDDQQKKKRKKCKKSCSCFIFSCAALLTKWGAFRVRIWFRWMNKEQQQVNWLVLERTKRMKRESRWKAAPEPAREEEKC